MLETFCNKRKDIRLLTTESAKDHQWASTL